MLVLSKIMTHFSRMNFLGFAVDTELRSGWSGLMYAANHANSKIVDLLLSSGANPNFQKGVYC